MLLYHPSLQFHLYPSHHLISSLFFFFFQAEDGIRDLYVTGVQTCALPISLLPRQLLLRRLQARIARHPSGASPVRSRGRAARFRLDSASVHPLPKRSRSEERRVGKECRSRWTTYH